MKNKLIPITILMAALLMGKSDDYKTLDYKYKVKKYDALRVYFDCSIGNLTMRSSNNRYIITGNIEFNSSLSTPIVELTNKNNISKLDIKIKPDKANKSINILLSIDNHSLKIIIPEDRITTSRNHVFLGWLLVSSSLLIIISFLFLRNQIRPITKLAKAAERFGKGQDIGDFKTSGASEVRLASAEFLKMKNRITRQIEQRSLMLAGVSHDLKTPLTRMRLQSESCLLYTSPSPRDRQKSRMPSSA